LKGLLKAKYKVTLKDLKHWSAIQTQRKAHLKESGKFQPKEGKLDEAKLEKLKKLVLDVNYDR
jgi:hypothetical protein